MNINRRIYLVIIMGVFLIFFSCNEGEIESPDIHNKSLLPKRSDYLNKDYGTQALAQQLNGIYNSNISLVYYDADTRTKPLLYLTKGKQDIYFKALSNGAVQVSYRRFHTEFMPLYMSFSIKILVSERNDTIYLRGSDGVVRTEGDAKTPIGTPFPESDDAELKGIYLPKEKKLGMLIDLMLSVPVKALVKGEKTNNK